MQKAIKVNDRDSLKELNQHLENGWKVIHTCSMPSSIAINVNGFSQTIHPTCLVILEDKQEKNEN